MNQMKTILRIADDVLLEPLGKEVLNFNSNKAYDYFVNAKDTHKSWQAMQVLLFGTTLELLREYIREEGEQPSVLRFFEWQADQECNNLKMVSQLILNYVLAIFVFRVGVRYNVSNLVNSARLKFDDLFYAFKHPIYREVDYSKDAISLNIEI